MGEWASSWECVCACVCLVFVWELFCSFSTNVKAQQQLLRCFFALSLSCSIYPMQSSIHTHIYIHAYKCIASSSWSTIIYDDENVFVLVNYKEWIELDSIDFLWISIGRNEFKLHFFKQFIWMLSVSKNKAFFKNRIN